MSRRALAAPVPHRAAVATGVSDPKMAWVTQHRRSPALTLAVLVVLALAGADGDEVDAETNVDACDAAGTRCGPVITKADWRRGGLQEILGRTAAWGTLTSTAPSPSAPTAAPTSEHPLLICPGHGRTGLFVDPRCYHHHPSSTMSVYPVCSMHIIWRGRLFVVSPSTWTHARSTAPAQAGRAY